MNNKDRIIQWIDVMLDEVSKLEDSRGIALLHGCGGDCSKTSALLQGAAKINNEYRHEKNPDKLFEIYKRQYCDTPRLMKEGDRITLIFEECTCPLVKGGIENPYLCHCTTGYTMKIFETLFGRTVDVELEQSILRGDKICKQLIRIGG